jgi:hypothetical protein
MADTLSTSTNTTQEDTCSIPASTSHRQSKYIRAQAIIATNESKPAPSKPTITRRIRGTSLI